MAIHDHGSNELTRLYGPWAGRTPTDAARLFAGYPGQWWVAGGWAMEAFTGAVRHHDNLDLEIPRTDLPLLRGHLAARFDVWTASDGALRPLLPDDDPDGAADAVLPADCGQVWLRPSGAEPWEYDVLLMTGDHNTWEFKRDHRIRLPVTDILWSRDQVAYLRPEIQLLLKARGPRPNDQRDFETVLPALDQDRRTWLREALNLGHPGHRCSRGCRPMRSNRPTNSPRLDVAHADCGPSCEMSGQRSPCRLPAPAPSDLVALPMVLDAGSPGCILLTLMMSAAYVLVARRTRTSTPDPTTNAEE